jgi:hypothetical protein
MNIYIYTYIYIYVGRKSVVGIETRYELDGPGIEYRWGRDFPRQSRPTLGPTQPPIQLIPGSFQGLERHGRGLDLPHPSSALVKERHSYTSTLPLSFGGLF